MKNLTVVSAWVRKPPLEEQFRREQSGQWPRETLYQTVLESDMLDGRFLESTSGFHGILYRWIPATIAQTLEAFRLRKRYDVIITWNDEASLLFALLQKITGSRKPHVAMMFWISKAKKAFLLRIVHHRIDKIILWTSTHVEFATRKLGIPESRIVYIRHYVDQQFWHPEPADADMICSAGREMRDYPTLIRAMRGLSIPCHLATAIRGNTTEPWIKAIYRDGELPSNVSVGPLSPMELRKMYSRSRFVVVPLLPSDSDNGLNVILEGMAMGRAVICSRIYGQRDVLQEGKTGIFVPPGDWRALREAIVYLWNNPAVAETMGKEGRKYVEKHHSLDAFVNSVNDVVRSVYKSCQDAARK